MPEPWTTERPRLLVIADDQGAGELLARLLDRAGWTTDLAFSGASGLHQLEGGGAGYDAVILDLASSAQDIEALLALRSDRATSALRVIVCLRADQPDPDGAAVEAWNAGTDGILVHPFGADAFTDEIANVVVRADHQREEHRRASVDRLRPGRRG